MARDRVSGMVISKIRQFVWPGDAGNVGLSIGCWIHLYLHLFPIIFANCVSVLCMGRWTDEHYTFLHIPGMFVFPMVS